MKKFLPYILIVAMMGTFGWLSFASSVSNAKQAEAEGFTDSVFYVGGKIWTLVKSTGAAGPTMIAMGDWGKIADATIGQLLAWIAGFIWHISSLLFTFSGHLLDYAVDFSVKDFKTNIDQIEVIDTGYKIILNVANMLFIFILLYIAIKTILGMGGDTKKLLTNIIIVGLFINFSLFMTKTIIDASNILAMGFYNGVQTEAGETEEGQTIISQGSIATAMMAGLKLQTMIPSSDSEYNKEDPSKGLTNFNIMINYLGGSALFLVSAFVFLSVALLFIVRFVALLFYMLFSPVAFLGMILPEFKKYSSQWWHGLQSQALFAPAFLFMAYLISAIINSEQLWDAVGGSSDTASNFHDVISSTGRVGFGIIMNYVILMALMIGALIMAKKMAGEGSAGVLKYTNKFQGWAQGVAGRNTLGRAAYMANNTNAMNWLESKSPMFGGVIRDQLDNVSGVSFGGRKGGYAKALKDKVKRSTERSKRMEYKGKDAKEMDEEIKRAEGFQKQRMKDLPNLKEKAESAKKKYETAKTKEEGAQKEYDTWQDDISENKLKQAKAEAEQAKQEFEREQGRHKETDQDIKDAKKIIEDNKEKLDKLKNKYKTAYAENLGYGWSVLNKLFPSGADAAAEIRKGKSKGEKEVAELVEKLVEEKTKEKGGGGEAPKEEKTKE